MARWAMSLAAGFVLFFVTSSAHAYPWMIRHGYSGCTPCHTDPSGGAGALTEYGRAQSDLLLRMRYGESSDSGEADRTSQFLGFVPLPEQARLGGDFREGFLSTQASGAPLQQQWITMRADLYGDFKFGRFRAAGSIGYIPQGDLTASLTTSQQDNLISREHWLGVELDEDGAFLLRGGRIALPFGIRMIEHTLWARQLTRTDIDDTQQYGIALAFAHDKWRGEAMGIAGNFEISPDEFRERGYSAYVEYAPLTTLAVGESSMFTRATRDIVYGVTDYRYSNGPFLRYAPWQQLVFLAEIDSVYQSLTWNGHRGGYAGFAQADYEPAQGFHLMLTGEVMNGGSAGEPPSADGWLSAVWFFLPHMDLRFDTIFSALGSAGVAGGPSSYTNETLWMAQFHVFL
ncbi:MAG: hypothetical protein ACLP1X_03380 [Polyangiaceae bacterium]|jgi:hypothetical protein